MLPFYQLYAKVISHFLDSLEHIYFKLNYFDIEFKIEKTCPQNFEGIVLLSSVANNQSNPILLGSLCYICFYFENF